MSTPFVVESDHDVVSVFEAAYLEACQHRWIESQKRHCDAGYESIREWYQRFWWTFLRYRHLEHLLGDHPWSEFGVQSFGVLQPYLQAAGELAENIVELYRTGWENLDIINWAIQSSIAMDTVYECLELINMNDARIDPRFN